MVLKAENLSIGYSAASPVFVAIDFCVKQGDMVALVGVNGAGKTTLLRTIAGLQNQLSGTLTLGDNAINTMSASERATKISIVLTEKINIDNITAYDYIALGRLPYTNWLGTIDQKDKEVIQRTIEVMQVTAFQQRMYNELSDGERQRVSIARALAQDTDLIVLDEPTAFLDFKAKHTVLHLLQNIAHDLKKTILMSTHDLEATLPHCSLAWVMTENGKFITAGNKPEDVKKLFS